MEHIDINQCFASGNLEGKVISGWKVLRKFAEPNYAKHETGGAFSVCYEVEKNGIIAFMKVLDYVKIFKHNKGQLTPEIMQRAATEFNYEKSLSRYCKNRKITKVVSFIDSGDVFFDGFLFNGSVSYIIYEIADGDVRKVMNLSSKTELAAKINSLSMKLKSLHDVSVGINQLHTNEISHQDIKPSNILSFSGESKIGDLGRSLIFDSEVVCPYPMRFNGDRNYAAPECFYPNYSATKEALYQVDNYMLGGLVTFYIAGVTFNLLLHNYLPDEYKFLKIHQNESFINVLPDMINAYQNALSDFEKEIPINEVKSGLVTMVSYLCNPDPAKRGHPKNVFTTSRTQNYDLQRTIQELDLLQKKAELALIKK